MKNSISNQSTTTLGAVITASTEKANPLTSPDVPYVGLEHIEKDLGIINGFETASVVRSTKSVFRRGDLLYGKLRPYLNKVWLAEFDGMCSTDILVYPKKDMVDNCFLKYRFMSRDFVNYAAENSNGVNLPRVNAKVLSRFSLWLPPLDEQRRIVAEIEKQFTRLDAGVAALQRVQVNLKRYRAAVLKAACEGRLVPTEAELACTEGRDYECAKVLLQRILSESREKWNGRGKYKEPAAPDVSDLLQLPEGWVWASVDQLADVALGKMLDKNKHQTGTQLKYLRNINVRWGFVDTSNLFEMFFKDQEIERYSLRQGDVLVCEGGEPGRAAMWDDSIEGMMYQKAIHRVRQSGALNSKYLVYFLELVGKTGRLEKWFTGSTIKHFTRESFLRLPIPLPPLGEQERIVAEVERSLSVIDRLEASVTANLQRATRLRHAILQKALSGK